MHFREMIKYIFFSFMYVCLALSSTLTAQTKDEQSINTRNKFVGGSVFTSSVSTPETSVNGNFLNPLNVSISPYLGVEVSERVSLGGSLLYGFRKDKYVPNIIGYVSENSLQQFGMSVFVRNYLNDGTFRFFMESSINYSLENFEQKETPLGVTSSPQPLETKSSRNVFNLAANPVVSYRAGRFRLLGKLGGLSYTANGERRDKDTDDLLVSGNSEFTFGLFTRNIGLGAEFIF